VDKNTSATNHEAPVTNTQAHSMDGESQEERDRRLRELWDKLDARHSGAVDLVDLKAGLQRMNHPLKDADVLIRDMLKTCDINNDGEISYDEFVRFCTQTEKELWQLFESIDRDHNGKLDKGELSLAFERAGVMVSNARLDRFFSYIDKNHDGRIDFSEWRGASLKHWSQRRPSDDQGRDRVANSQEHVLDFLLFLPTHAPGLKTVLNYYNSTARLTAEGDVHLSDEALSGLGMVSDFLKTSLFGAIIMLAWPSEKCRNRYISTSHDEDDMNPSTTSPDYGNAISLPEDAHHIQMIEDNDPHIPIKPARRKEPESIRLTDFVPNIGYFAAGGLSGITSRTATAPLDRLKVYLIAQTGTSNAQEALQAAKSGAPSLATKRGISTLAIACKELWAAGGVRSLFAGISTRTHLKISFTDPLQGMV